MTDESNKQFKMQRLYVKDISFESPAVPELFKKRVEPTIEMQIRVAAQSIGEDRYEVAIDATVTARVEERTVFLCEVEQAGIFLVRNMPADELQHMLHVFCPAQLFPFLREVIADVTQKGGFPPVLLAPVRFEEIYRASRQPGAAG